MYATVMTRPDIAFAVSILSQHLESPTTTHLQAIVRVFRYLSGTKNLKLVLGGLHSNIIGYSDSDWASQTHRHSTSSLVQVSSPGAQKNNPSSLSSALKPNMSLSPTPQKISFGF